MDSDVAKPIDGLQRSNTANSSSNQAPKPYVDGPMATVDGNSSTPLATSVLTSEPGEPPPKHKANAKSYIRSSESHARFPRISRPVELMRTSYDVVVIGSGYGGGVAASRMARGRQSVCLLERGKEKWPGEYPEELEDALKDLHVSGQFAPGQMKGKWVEGGDPTGLYHLVVGEGQNAFVGNGLGGTSLLNANVFLEADSKVLNMNVWPEELRGESSWKKCMLLPSPSPIL
jgi:FAD binding domain